MFLNRLKTKSIIRQLEKANNERIPITIGNALSSVCIIEEESNKFDRTKLKKLAQILNTKEENIHFRSFVKQKNKTNKDNLALISPKDIGWKGVFKTAGLKEFGKIDYDLLISYYKEEHVVLSAVSSLGKGKFKVRLGADSFLAHDLSLDVQEMDADLFLGELEKYLKILKII